MNILVTGGAGFIGSHVVDAYIRDGHRVAVADDLSSGKKPFVNPQAAFYQIDIQDPGLQDILKKESVEIINHHAAQISVTESMIDPVKDAKANIFGTLQLLENAVTLGVRKFVFASTGGAIYGDQDRFPADEEHPRRPSSPYGISKLAIEHYLKYYSEARNLDSAILRYGNVFGPRQNSEGEAGVVAVFCRRLSENRAPVVFGDGSQTRDFIHVRDVVRANQLALRPEFTGAYNIGAGRETSVLSLAERLVEISGAERAIEFGPARPGEQKRSVLSHNKILEGFGWEPITELEEGLVETFKSFS